MKIDVKGIGVGVGVGILDNEMEAADGRSGRVGLFKTYTDMSRAGVVALGYGLQAFMPKYADIGEKLAQSGTPLLTKTLYAWAKGAIGGTASTRTARASFQARRVSAVTPSNMSYQVV